jgi:hypothetical protein
MRNSKLRERMQTVMYECAAMDQETVAFMLAEARVSRTHRRPLRTTAGFEDREDHRSLSTSVLMTFSRATLSMLHVILYALDK